MRIVICSNSYPPNFIGGAELIAHNQALELNRHGHDVIVFAGETTDDTYERHSVKVSSYAGLTVYRVQLYGSDFDRAATDFIHENVVAAFYTILLDFKPDVVHFHNIVGLSPKLIPVANELGVKTIVTLHDNWGFCYKNTIIRDDGSVCNNFSNCRCGNGILSSDGKRWPQRLRRDYIKLALSSADLLISPSEYLANNYARAGFKKPYVLWNGIGLVKFQDVCKSTSEKVRFTFIGYMGQHKGIGLLLEALFFLRRYRKQIHVNLVGTGDQLEEYRHMAEWLDLPVTFYGKVHNEHIMRVYEETDVLILPSIWPENQPVSITEAMACKLPTITTDQGGGLELVRDGETGLLFKLGNSADLAKKMEVFILDRSLAAEMGSKAYEKIKNYSFSNQAAQLADIYAGITKKRKLFDIVSVNGDNMNDTIIEAINSAYWGVYFIAEEHLTESMKEDVGAVFYSDNDTIPKSCTYYLREKRIVITASQNTALLDFFYRSNGFVFAMEDPSVLKEKNILRFIRIHQCRV